MTNNIVFVTPEDVAGFRKIMFASDGYPVVENDDLHFALSVAPDTELHTDFQRMYANALAYNWNQAQELRIECLTYLDTLNDGYVS